MAYCTADDVIAAGVAADADGIDQAISDATEIVNEHCGELFETTEDFTVVAEFGPDGVAPLPRRVQTVDSVTFIGATTALDDSAYRVRKGSDPGDIDAVEMIGTGVYDDLVAGAERWRGGYANLARPGRRITVVGTFGYATVPANARRATALLAADLINNPKGSVQSGAKSVTVGDVSVNYGLPDHSATTGLLEVDRLLVRLRRY